jgi:calmodulin
MHVPIPAHAQLNLPACPPGDLFHALDNYLKTNRVRFADVFQEFDADSSGSLEGPEISRLVRRLLPAVSDHELRYFWAMMDTNGDGHITQQEFLSAARDCLEAEKAAAARQRELTDTLNHIAAFLRKEQVGWGWGRVGRQCKWGSTEVEKVLRDQRG